MNDNEIKKTSHSKKEWNDGTLDGIILKILKSNNKLRATDIRKALIRHDIQISDKTVTSHIRNLQEFGQTKGLFSIITKRKESDTENNDSDLVTKTHIYYTFKSPLSDGQCKMLFDSFSRIKGISNEHRSDIIKFMACFKNEQAVKSMNHINDFEDDCGANEELVQNIQKIVFALNNSKAIKFYYNDYNEQKKLTPRKDKDGNIRSYIVRPLKITVHLGRYYLVCQHLNHNNISNIRIDRMTSVFINRSNITFPDIPENDLCSLRKHIPEHTYMFSDKVVNADIVIPKSFLNDVIDRFGNSAVIYKYDSQHYKISVKVDETSLIYWALQYSTIAVVIAPESLVIKISEHLQQAVNNYNNILMKDNFTS